MRTIAVLDPLGMYYSLYAGPSKSCWCVARSWSDIEIKMIFKRTASVSILNKPISYYDAILYTGVPAFSCSPQSPTDRFVQIERSRALSAALSYSPTKVINAGWHLSDNWTVQSPEYMTLLLARLGWRIPQIRYSLTADGRFRKSLNPEPHSKCFLLIDVRDYYLTPDKIVDRDAVSAALIKRTRSYFLGLQLDWICLLLATDSFGSVYAYGLTVAVPTEFGAESISRILGGVFGE
jgi:hypothetical protein